MPPDLAEVMHPLRPMRTLFRHRQLIKQLCIRELAQRYRGSYLGFLWSFLTPLAHLAVYTFVFSVVLRARWADIAGVSSSATYALALFAGLVPFNVFAEVANRAPHLVVSVPSYVKKVLFPVEILPVVALLTALIHASAGLLILAVITTLLVGPPAPGHVLLLPFAFVPLLLLSLAAGWILASLGVFIRDVGHAVVVVVQLSMFLCPVVYPLEAVPERMRFLLFLNPLTATVEASRALMLWNETPAWTPVVVWTAITGVAAWLSFVWFLKTKKGFADVL